MNAGYQTQLLWLNPLILNVFHLRRRPWVSPSFGISPMPGAATWLALVVASSGRIQDELTAVLGDDGLKIQVGIPQISTSGPSHIMAHWHMRNPQTIRDDQGRQIESS